MNRCHPYAQCIYVTSTADYECRCNPGYEGDGMECIKTGTFHPHLRHLLLLLFLLIIEYRDARRNARIHCSRVLLNAEVSCLEVDICDPNASCQQEESLAKCVCNPGFEGDGTTCSPIGHIFRIFSSSSSSHYSSLASFFLFVVHFDSVAIIFSLLASLLSLAALVSVKGITRSMIISRFPVFRNSFLLVEVCSACSFSCSIQTNAAAVPTVWRTRDARTTRPAPATSARAIRDSAWWTAAAWCPIARPIRPNAT